MHKVSTNSNHCTKKPHLSRSTRPRITAKGVHEPRTAFQENSLVSDQAIAEYLRRVPHREEMGKFGVPQDKHRWGFYGSRSMEYDIWRRT